MTANAIRDTAKGLTGPSSYDRAFDVFGSPQAKNTSMTSIRVLHASGCSHRKHGN